MTEEQDIQLRLVISNEDGRASGVQPATMGPSIGCTAVIDVEPHAREQQHDPLEAARGGPLAQAAVAHDGQQRGRDDAVHGADQHGDEGGEPAAVELERGGMHGAREDEQRVHRGRQHRGDGDQVEEEGRHGCQAKMHGEEVEQGGGGPASSRVPGWEIRGRCARVCVGCEWMKQMPAGLCW